MKGFLSVPVKAVVGRLPELSDQQLVEFNLEVVITRKKIIASDEETRALARAICAEAERRGWPDGWWEDPSIIPGWEEWAAT